MYSQLVHIVHQIDDNYQFLSTPYEECIGRMDHVLCENWKRFYILAVMKLIIYESTNDLNIYVILATSSF